MDDVFLEGATPDGPAVVGHLSVIVDTDGITFLGPEPGDRRMVGWDRMSPLEFGPPAALPDGMAGTSLEFELDGRPLRLLVPSKTGPAGIAGAEATEPSADVVVAVPPAPSGPAAVPVMPGAPPVVEPAFVPAPALVVLASAALAVESPLPVVASSPAPEVESPPPVVVSPAPAVESPPPVVVASAAPAVESPPPVVAPRPAPAVESPPPVVVASAAPVVASAAPVVASPAPVVPASPAPVVVSPVSAPADFVSTTDPKLEELPTDEVEWAPAQPRAWYRPSPRLSVGPRVLSPFRTRRTLRLVLLAVLAALVPLAAGVWYAHLQPAAGGVGGGRLSDTRIAARVGIQPGDLPNWSSSAPRMGNAFAAGATTNGSAGLSTALQASTDMARCLHVPISAVEGAFGMGNAISQRTAETTSPSYADPGGNGGAVNSVVDVVKTPQIENADSMVFQDPSLFATCYQPYVQAMLPYATGTGAGPGFATATVQPIDVPVPPGPDGVEVAAFQIARIANDPGQTTTVVTTAIAVFGGRVQATLGTVSNFVFSIDAQNQLVHDVEVRTIGVSEL